GPWRTPFFSRAPVAPSRGVETPPRRSGCTGAEAAPPRSGAGQPCGAAGPVRRRAGDGRPGTPHAPRRSPGGRVQPDRRGGVGKGGSVLAGTDPRRGVAGLYDP